jgi:hypothetical protein
MADRRLTPGKTGVKPGENHPQNREQNRGKTGVKPGATCTPHTPQCFRTRLWARAQHLEQSKFAIVGRSEQSRLRRGLSADARHDLLGGPNFLCITITRKFRGLAPSGRDALPAVRLPFRAAGSNPSQRGRPIGRLLRSSRGRPRQRCGGSRQVVLVRHKPVGSRTFIRSHVEHGHGRRCATLWPFGVRHVHP